MVAAGQDMHRLRRLFVILDKQAPLAVEKFDPQMPTFQQFPRRGASGEHRQEDGFHRLR